MCLPRIREISERVPHSSLGGEDSENHGIERLLPGIFHVKEVTQSPKGPMSHVKERTGEHIDVMVKADLEKPYLYPMTK